MRWPPRGAPRLTHLLTAPWRRSLGPSPRTWCANGCDYMSGLHQRDVAARRRGSQDGQERCLERARRLLAELRAEVAEEEEGS